MQTHACTKGRLLGQCWDRPGHMRAWLGVAVTSSFLLGVTAPVWAFEESAKSGAMLRYQTANAHYQKHQYREAAAEFSGALETLPLPVIALWAARSAALGGDLVAAQAAYRKAIALAPNELWFADKQQRAQSDADRELRQVNQRVAKLRINLPEPFGSDGQVLLDGVLLAPGSTYREVAVNAGNHVVLLKLPHGTTEQRVTVAEGQVLDVKLEVRSQENLVSLAVPHPELERTPAVQSAWRTVGWLGVSVGGAALAFGTVTGLMLRSRHGDMTRDCPRGTCDPGVISGGQVDEYNRLRVASSAGLVAGGLLGVAGLTLILATPAQESKPEVVLRITSTGPLLEGAF